MLGTCIETKNRHTKYSNIVCFAHILSDKLWQQFTDSFADFRLQHQYSLFLFIFFSDVDLMMAIHLGYYFIIMSWKKKWFCETNSFCYFFFRFKRVFGISLILFILHSSIYWNQLFVRQTHYAHIISSIYRNSHNHAYTWLCRAICIRSNVVE